MKSANESFEDIFAESAGRAVKPIPQPQIPKPEFPTFLFLGRSMERAVKLNAERVQAGGLCQGLSGSGAEVWDMSGPHHIKASIAIKDKSEAITSFVKDASPRLAKGVCEVIVSHAVIRSDVKADGIDLLMELSKQLPDLIPTFVAICHARCAGSELHHIYK